MNPLWVLGILLCGILVLSYLGFFTEGFQSQNPNTINPANQFIRCPPTYTFFNGPDGTSMCCRGTLNPYTHQCIGATARNDMCTFSANEKDPRPAFKGDTLPECRNVTIQQAVAAAETCPSSLPYFAKESDTSAKCCKNPVQLHGDTGFTCSTEDLKDTEKYCISAGTPTLNKTTGKMERLCNEAHMIDTATCPLDVTGKRVFQNVTYIMGDREATHYDTSDLKGLTIPTCYRLNETCIPESAIKYAQSRMAYTEYDADTWEYSCKVWSKRNRGEIVPNEVKGYLRGTYDASQPP